MKAKNRPTPKAGGSLSRSEIVQVRVDPKLKMSAELAAASERRTVSSFIEWALQRAVREVQIAKDESGKPLTAWSVTDACWDVDDADRFVKLAMKFPELLTLDEQRIWKVIQEFDWEQSGDGVTHRWRFMGDDGQPSFGLIRRCWGTIQGLANAEAAGDKEEVRMLTSILTNATYGFQPEIVKE